MEAGLSNIRGKGRWGAEKGTSGLCQWVLPEALGPGSCPTSECTDAGLGESIEFIFGLIQCGPLHTTTVLYH